MGVEEKQKLKKQLKDPTFTKTKEKKQIHQEAGYITRQCKNKRKQKKLRVFNEEDDGPTASKKQKKKSSFESEIVNTSTKSVKAFRHVANKKKNDDRRMSKKGRPGGKPGGKPG